VIATRPRKLFVNLPVSNLDRTVEFFGKLGFRFDKRFTDEKATCMILNDEAYVMLLVDKYFGTFTKKRISDTATFTESICAISAESREEVDQIADTAIAAGGSQAIDPQDHGFMYGRSFYDLDGHHWEVFWMDPSALEQ
jgi:uncharacterized protein